jgi:hypothetical protein
MESMKILKFLLYSFFSLTIVILIANCEDDDDNNMLIAGYDHLLNECNGHNYIVNEEGTACICPEDTHYKLELIEGSQSNSVPKCIEILPGSFLYKANSKTCLYEVRDSSIAGESFLNVYDGIGMAEFNFANGGLYLWLGSGSYGQRFTSSIFGLGSIDGQPGEFKFHEDGSFSVVYQGIGNMEGHCLDWVERNADACGHVFYVTTTGRSNPEQTKINLEMTWKDCQDNILDVGLIEMWKEW